MGLMAPGMERLLDIPQFQQVLSSYHGDFRDPLWRPQERPVIMLYIDIGTSLVAQRIKRLLTMRETQVWEDPLEKQMATHSSTLA